MPDWRQALTDRLAALRLRPEREAEIVDELSQHLDDQVRELVAGGMDAETARTVALAELDAPGELARRLAGIETRPALALPPPGAPSRGRFLQARWQDLRHSIRSLRRSPIFTATVLLTFALTIGPTTAILSVGNWLLWRPTPGVHQPDRLAIIWFGQWRNPPGGGVSVSPSGVSYLNLEDLRRASKTFSGIAGIQEDGVSIAADAVAPSIGGAAYVTADALDVLGVPVIAGRMLRSDEDREPAGEPVAMVSETLARRAFGDVQRAVNGRILINGKPMTIVGVLPARFAGVGPTSRVSVWYPGSSHGYVNHYEASARSRTREDGLFYSFVARLAPGATFESAQAELDVIVPALAQSHPDENGKFKEVRARVFSGLGPQVLQRKSYVSNVRILVAIGGVLLLLGCANVANVLMVRSVRTGRDRAIRLALGASRARLALLQLTESTLLAAGGAALGILLAVWLKQLIVSLLFPGMPPGLEFQVPLDLRVLGLTLGISLTCGLVAGLAPALLSRRTGVTASIAAAGTRSATGMHWVRAGMASFQLALSLALVVGSLLLVATLRNLSSVDIGFSPDNVTRHHIDPPQHGYTRDRTVVYFQDLLNRLRQQPGIDAISVASRTPFGSSSSIRLPDPAGADRPPIRVISNSVSAGYFNVLGIKLVAGRGFNEAEAMTPAGAPTYPVVITQNLAVRLFGNAQAVGRSITLPRAGSSPARDVSIIGVTNDVHWNSLIGERPLFMYQPFPQGSGSGSGSVLLRSALPLHERIRMVERVTGEIDSSMPVSFSQPLSASIESEVSEQRTFAWVLSLVGWIAFTLAAVGLYGLLAQSVSERTREFGIRLAIGSGTKRIFALVLRQAAMIGAIGGVAGLALAAVGTRLIESQLHGVTRLNVTTYVVSAAILVVVVFIAGLWPARTATRVQPVEALRVE